MLLEMDIQDLLNEEKRIEERLEWTRFTAYEYRLVDAVVKSNLSNDLVLKARSNKAGLTHFILQEGQRDGRIIRRWGNESGHVNPETHERFDTPHKHYWTDKWADKMAYCPNPPIDNKDVNRGLMDFLQECHITAEDGIDHFPGFVNQRALFPAIEHLTNRRNKEDDEDEIIEEVEMDVENDL